MNELGISNSGDTSADKIRDEIGNSGQEEMGIWRRYAPPAALGPYKTRVVVGRMGNSNKLIQYTALSPFCQVVGEKSFGR